ncbi:MAG: tRNA (guanosine(46)-N7)-methyltransferase TrmB [Clostridiales bacterium]|nr:tRNA (guanosine(46)-N7)-methyltransferase TrmB [Clostridiales bacterium]
MRLRRQPQAKIAVQASPLVLPDPLALRGKWRGLLGPAPLRLEIGMGRGRFITAQALSDPQSSYLGLDFREEMVFLALSRLQGHEPANLRFLWCNAALLPEIFAPGELDGLYLNFPDPWPKARHAKRRLTHELFWRQYAQVLAEGGEIRLRTDARDFFEWSLESLRGGPFALLQADYDAPLPEAGEASEYEERYRALGQSIYSAEWRKEQKFDANGG